MASAAQHFFAVTRATSITSVCRPVTCLQTYKLQIQIRDCKATKRMSERRCWQDVKLSSSTNTIRQRVWQAESSDRISQVQLYLLLWRP